MIRSLIADASVSVGGTASAVRAIPRCVLWAPDGLLEAVFGAAGLFVVEVAGAIAQHDIFPVWRLHLQGVELVVGGDIRIETKFVEAVRVAADAVRVSISGRRLC